MDTLSDDDDEEDDGDEDEEGSNTTVRSSRPMSAYRGGRQIDNTEGVDRQIIINIKCHIC